ncbi:polyribonucleotide nucleotidyltransferase [Marispirochaeta sp.]|uniref:polyribonucleotide nucleotidyltransferase n=1 Tax=Marispirochaeta sp. TaxID=2038653 RepID=UPI0029C71D43|nr:polyribonucleotide nucleotidyltransferase [Marispirochaeta sp.]
MNHSVTIPMGNGELILETGKMAKQANGAVFARYEGSAVLATVCCSDKPVEGLDYVPLQVEYNEKYYAAGKIPGGFLKREGRPKDKEILVCRLIDRPMRPLFHKSFQRDIQVVPTVVSADQINPPDIIAMVAASAAVVISDIPFEGPVGAVRISSIDGELIINPTFDQIERSELDIIVSGTNEGITMVEGGAKEVSEERMLEAIALAESEIKKICAAQLELREKAGKEKLPLVEEEEVFSLEDEIKAFAAPKLEEACFVPGKFERYAAIKAVKNETLTSFEEKLDDDDYEKVDKIFEKLEYDIVRASILQNGKRTDGRGVEDIRPISCEIRVLPRTHGSALFTRGETQALAVTTLGTVSDEKIVDDIDGDKSYESFMLHYNFPPFSVGETGRMGTGRREIGHGHLAQRAIEGVLPKKEDFPYTIRVVSEILESNGSSSMATVCGSSLSLQSAGVPIKKPVAGIAMGLISSPEKTVVLSDILGEEDHLGDMDFKVAGTEDGITAFQMDIKISGVSQEIMATALNQAKKGRMHILGIMNETVSSHHGNMSEYAPKILTLKVEEDKIGLIIGPGGKTIKSISERSGSTINIDDTGRVVIFGKDQASAEAGEAMVRALVEEPEIGTIYKGIVKRIMDFGAFVEILPGKEGLVHISKLSRERVNAVSDVLKVEQEIPVKLIEIDRMGRINLSYIDAIDPDSGKSGNQGQKRQ